MKCNKCRDADAEFDTPWERFRQWMFSWFNKDIVDLSQERYTQGFGDGYTKGFEIAEEQQKEYLKLINDGTLAPPKFRVEDVIKQINKEQVVLGGKLLTKEETKSLKEECRFFSTTRLKNIFFETLKEQACELLYNKSQTVEDIKDVKMMLRNIEVQENILKLLSK